MQNRDRLNLIISKTSFHKGAYIQNYINVRSQCAICRITQECMGELPRYNTKLQILLPRNQKIKGKETASTDRTVTCPSRMNTTNGTYKLQTILKARHNTTFIQACNGVRKGKAVLNAVYACRTPVKSAQSKDKRSMGIQKYRSMRSFLVCNRFNCIFAGRYAYALTSWSVIGTDG